MQGYTPKLPLTLDPTDGFLYIKNLKDLVAQNLKMLILTSPGERIMIPEFGVGIYNFLFELNTQHTQVAIRERIEQQVNQYLPFVQILNIAFNDVNSPLADDNFLGMRLEYRIKPLNVVAVLNVKTD